MATVAGTEFVASFMAPAWPARDLRPVSAEALKEQISSAFIDMPQLVPVFNERLTLRKLVEENPSEPKYIQTVWGFGYVFVPDGGPR